jgi:hypothetical protein
VDERSLPGIPRSALLRAAADFVRRGWLMRDGNAWRVAPGGMPEALPAFLEGAAAVQAMLTDTGTATAAVTMPVAPSAISTALLATGLTHAGLRTTSQAMERVADAATASLTVMTPFLNTDGLAFATALFERTRADARRLVIRRSPAARTALASGWPALISLGVSVLNYLLPAGDGYETFHAKVVLADGCVAYVGSANLLLHLRRSMELGIVVDGRAARVVASVVRAAEAVSIPVGSP